MRSFSSVAAGGLLRPALATAAALLATALCSSTALAQPSYGMPPGNAAFPQPTGFETFQLTPPYTTENPFDADDLQAIQSGFELFTTETFDGNGRTCSTCHLPERNYNLSLADFEALSPADQQLVLGGSNTDLENAEAVTEAVLFNINQSAGPGTEGDIPTPDGPFRSSMSIGGLGFATLNNHMCKNGQASPAPGGRVCTIGPGGPPARNGAVDDGIRDLMLGWSGEGPLAEHFPWWDGAQMQTADCDGIIDLFATDNHTLRDLDLALATFALAAVKTHFPITQSREPGTDFRCPDQQELLDMAIFQKWLGRRFELDITKLQFKAAAAQRGRNLFSTRQATCVACHVNAGGSDTQGRQKTTPVPFLTMDGQPDPEFVPDHEQLFLIGTNKTSRNGSQAIETSLAAQFGTFAFPFDPGDHELRSGPLGLGPRQGGFNVQSIIEAVRNRQFFHNNGVTGSIEDAIEFYFTDAFKASQGGNAISGDFRLADPHDESTELTPQEARAFLGGDQAIAEMGLFLRSLSAIYIFADCERFIDEMGDRARLGLPMDLPADHCRFALGDAYRILTEVKMPSGYGFALLFAQIAESSLIKALNAADATTRNRQLGYARYYMGTARRLIAKTPELY